MITKNTKKVYCTMNYSKHCAFDFFGGRYYKVIITDEIINNKKYLYARIVDEHNKTLNFFLESEFNTDIIHHWFITTQELRKLKIKKLKNVHTSS